MKILLLSALLISATAHGAQQQVQCPARYPAEVIRLSGVPNGWDGEDQLRGKLPLDGEGFVIGPITGSSKGEMMGSGDIKTKDGFETRYLLDGRIKERWFYCGYGGVELFHRISKKATQCVIKTTPRKYSRLDIGIDCK